MSQLRQLASPGCGPDEVAQVKSVASLPRPPKAKEYVMNSDTSYRTRGRPTPPYPRFLPEGGLTPFSHCWLIHDLIRGSLSLSCLTACD